ncbi:MAG: PEP-CTERM sorting domain-containing protein [Tepidisphaeraceae bacterium]|jgi:hypothetical protein
MNKSIKASIGLMVIASSAVMASGQAFPAKGNQTTGGYSALGTVLINVAPEYQPLMTDASGYNAGVYTSPLLYDPASVVGNSDPLLSGSAAETNGVPVGTANTNVSSASLTYPGAFTSAGANTREEFDQVVSLDMTNGSGISLLMGSSATNQPNKTFGEVQSNSGPGGNAANDFPAQSFFDIFAEVDMSISSTPVQLTNSAPLIEYAPSASGLGPLYPFGGAAPPAVVPIYFANDVPAFGNAALKGDQFGTFTIQPYLYNFVVPEPSSVLVLGLGAVGLLSRRRRAAGL